MASGTRETDSGNPCHCHVHQVGVEIVAVSRVLCYIQPILITEYIILLIFSGSTGTPKGVVLTHGNMAFTLGAFLYNLDPLPDDMYIAYLPLAHVLELLGRKKKFKFLYCT